MKIAEPCTIRGGRGNRGGNITLDTGSYAGTLSTDELIKRLSAGLERIGPGGLTLKSGQGAAGGLDGIISFSIGGTEILRIDADGTFKVRGERIGEDKEVLVLLRAWVGQAVLGLR